MELTGPLKLPVDCSNMGKEVSDTLTVNGGAIRECDVFPAESCQTSL